MKKAVEPEKMIRNRNASSVSVSGVCLIVFLILGLMGPATVFSAHKLADSQCYDCHVVGGSLADVVLQSRLIRGSTDMTEIIGGGFERFDNLIHFCALDSYVRR